MNITTQYSPDICDIDQTLSLYEKQKKVFIKCKLLSGEYDDQLLAIALSNPIVPLLFYSGKLDTAIMEERYEESIFEFTEEARSFLGTLSSLEAARTFINHIPDALNDTVYEIYEKANIRLNLSNNKEYVINLFDENLDTLDNYTYCIRYYSNTDLTYLYDYWFDLLEKRKEDYLLALQSYTHREIDIEGEEVVDIGDL